MSLSTRFRLLAAALALGAAPLAFAVTAPAAPAGQQTAQIGQGSVANQVTDPAARPVRAFYEALLYAMKHAKQLGVMGRYKQLEPAVSGAFDFDTMTKFTVGDDWTSLSDADRQALVHAFSRLTTADYARNFDGFDGESFVIASLDERSGDKILKTQMIVPGKPAIDFTYRLRKAATGWRIVDIYLQGFISEVATRRADFASTLKSGGAKALTAKLEQMADDTLKGKE